MHTTKNENQFSIILHTLDENNILKDLILIGSWSLLFYTQTFDDFVPPIRTRDIDFYIFNINRMQNSPNITEPLKKINFDVFYDTLTRKSRFVSPDGFELEFLTNLNRSGLTCVKIGNTGIYAESLPYIDMFMTNYVEVSYEGLRLKVPSPSAFVLQKLIINRDRRKKQKKISNQ